MGLIVNDKLFILGGASVANDTAFSNILDGGRDVNFNASGGITGSINSTANSLLGARALGIAVAGSGFFYFIGGTSDGTNALATVERTF